MAKNASFSPSPPSYDPNKNPKFQLIPCIILHDLSLLCSFIISQPLYSSYFLFFSPYLIRFISSIAPLFIATTFLFLLLTTTTAFCPQLPQSEFGIIQTVLKELKSNLYDVTGDDEECDFEDFEVYKIVFGGGMSITIGDEEDCRKELTVMEMIPEASFHGGRRTDIITTNRSEANNFEKLFEELEVCKIVLDGSLSITIGDEEDSRKELSVTEMIPEASVHGGRRNDRIANNLEKLIEELDRFEEFTPEIQTNSDESTKEEPHPVRKVDSRDNCQTIQNSGVVRVHKSSSWRSNSSSSFSFSSHGSMREEKEWRRTLACKLFEERHNSGTEDGMDSLWEAYENDNSKNRKEIMMKNSNNGGIKNFEDDDEEEEGMSNGHLCCLQALKFSTGRMKFGMGKPNLVKITKAFKGFGWLHHVTSKHGKKR